MPWIIHYGHALKSHMLLSWDYIAVAFISYSLVCKVTAKFESLAVKEFKLGDKNLKSCYQTWKLSCKRVQVWDNNLYQAFIFTSKRVQARDNN